MKKKGIENKSLEIYTPILLSIVMVIGMVFGAKLNKSVNGQPQSPRSDGTLVTQKKSSKHRLVEILNYIEAKYVDPVDIHWLENQAIESITSQLDPHTNYLNHEALSKSNLELDGTFEGIGAEFYIISDTVTVSRIINNSPAHQSNLKVGEQILYIDDSAMFDAKLTPEDIVQHLKGKKGTTVKLCVKTNDGNLVELQIPRKKIEISNVDTHYMVNQSTGLIRIRRFSSNVYREFMTSLEDLVENHQMKNLIIDVRDNPGGFLKQAVKILSQLFTAKDQLLVYTQGRTSRREEHRSTGNAFYEIEKIAVLINHNSASASEIVAGSIQDLDRGVIIGNNSFGKGLVQEQYQLTDGSALRVTIAKYYTPSGRSLQKPYKKQKKSHTSDGEVQVSDNQEYTSASGRILKSEGGVQPDVTIDNDWEDVSNEDLELLELLPGSVMTFYRENRLTLPKSLDKLYSSIWMDRLFNHFSQQFANKVYLQKYLSSKRQRYSNRLIFQLATYQFGLKGAYQLSKHYDKSILKAEQLLKQTEPLAQFRN